MSTQQQQALDSLYAIDNVLTVKISMSQSDWDAVRTEQPAGGRCNFDWTGGSRFTWRKASSVEISGTRFPARTVFADVGIKKKSFCGSFDNEKPCLHVDFGKFEKSNVPGIEALIGSRYITLNNSIQDPSYIRQPLGYRLFALAGLPNSRCNFARVLVNGTPIGQGFAGVNAPGVYVNAEPIMPRYIERNFAGNMKGNLYEIEHGDDLTRDRLPFIGVESLSEFEDRADLALAAELIATAGPAGAAQVIDLDQFIRVYAMEFYLKHWDGYSRNTNNTYLYNDVRAVATPGVDQVNLKFIPWGLDQTLQPTRHFTLGTSGLVAKLVRGDATLRAQLIDQVRAYRSSVFGRSVQRTVLQPMIDGMAATLAGLGVPDVGAQVATVRQQLRLAASAGYLCAGLSAADAVYLRAGDTGDGLHAVNTETVPAGAVPPAGFEVVHRQLPATDDPSDLWTFGALGTGRVVTSVAFGRVLHASTMTSAAGHKLLYTCAPDNTAHAEEFTIVPVDQPDEFTYSGYFQLGSVRTGLRATYGTGDATPSGRPRVYQDQAGTDLYFY